MTPSLRALPEGLITLLRRHGKDEGVEKGLAALDEAAQTQESLIDALIEGGHVEEEPFLRDIAAWLGFPWIESSDLVLGDIPRQRLPAGIALRHQVLPWKADAHGLWLLTFDPFNLSARQVVTQAASIEGKIVWAMGPRRAIREGLRRGYGVGAETFERILEGRMDEGSLDSLKQEVTSLDSDDEEASVVKFVNQILREALRERATDIHVEPLENDLRIRYRIDGILHETPVPERIKVLQASVLSRLKIMAHLDIAERRLPQDGRINLELEGRPIDVRVATIPSVTGESISLRLLGQERFDFARLGLNTEGESAVRRLLTLPNGIVLLTGPTGCGKSTTLYTFLSTINTKERRIVTIEDPVENKIPGVIQIAVKPEIGLTFATGLRSILRGDPNVVMIGEMRDFDTAEIAIRAALTGHLVFSTLHTNDAIGGITRLIDMGIEPFLVSSSVRAFIAQRLVRVLCPHCSVPGAYPEEYLQSVGFPPEWSSVARRPVGCAQCRGTGYEGRAAIMEVCVLSPRLQEFVVQRSSAGILRRAAIENGMIPLREDGWRKVADGVTSIEEVVRVTSVESAE